MLYRLRRRSRGEGGFTLIELLVVILIIGILAAIAIPAFLNQKSKANDAAAKSQARTAQDAAETYSTGHEGTYTGLSVAEAQTIEPTLNDKTVAKLLKAESPKATSYTVESESVNTGNKYVITRNEAGEVERKCSTAGKGACPASGKW